MSCSHFYHNQPQILPFCRVSTVAHLSLPSLPDQVHDRSKGVLSTASLSSTDPCCYLCYWVCWQYSWLKSFHSNDFLMKTALFAKQIFHEKISVSPKTWFSIGEKSKGWLLGCMPGKLLNFTFGGCTVSPHPTSRDGEAKTPGAVSVPQSSGRQSGLALCLWKLEKSVSVVPKLRFSLNPFPRENVMFLIFCPALRML